jgi:quinol monooxygenase YgiN
MLFCYIESVGVPRGFISADADPPTMLVIHATFPIDPDSQDRALELATDLAEDARAEPGCLAYHVAVDAEDETRLRFFEQYEDEAAFGAHAQTDHFQSFAAALPDFLAGEPEITRFDVESASDVEL